LGARHARIILPLQDEKWGADLGCMCQRRALAIELRVLRRISELAKEVIAEVTARRLRHRLPRDDPDRRDTGREAIRPQRERHDREIAPVAAAVDTDSRGVGKLLIAEPRRAEGDIVEFLATPIVAVRFAPRFAVPGRPPR